MIKSNGTFLYNYQNKSNGQTLARTRLSGLFAHFLRDEKVPVGQENFANLELNVAINLL